MDFKVVITIAKPGIEIALYLATYFGRRKKIYMSLPIFT